jgi:hypothetical protein
MNQNEIIDEDLEEEKELLLFSSRIKFALTIFAILDVLSILLSYEEISAFLDGGSEFIAYAPQRLLLLISFAFTAVLFILQKKEGCWISFAQFPFRLMFMMLSFNFLIDLSGATYGTNYYWSVISLLFILEISRFILTLIIYRKMDSFR